MLLNEELFQDATDEQTSGILNLLTDQISKFWNVVSDIESIKVTAEAENFTDMVPVIENISTDIHNDIGQLEQLIGMITPRGNDVELGKEEAITILDTEDTSPLGISESFTGNCQWEVPLFQEVYDIVNSLSDIPEVCEVASDNKFNNDFFFISFCNDLSYSQAAKVVNFLQHEGVQIRDWELDSDFNSILFIDIRDTTTIDEALRNKNNIKRQKSKLNLESVSEPLSESEGDIKSYFVSYYEELPSFNEETESYDVECNLVSSEEFDNLEEAKDRLKELTQDQVEEGSLEEVTDEFCLDRSRYVGVDKFWIIEEEKGSEEIKLGTELSEIPEDDFEDIEEIKDDEIYDYKEE